MKRTRQHRRFIAAVIVVTVILAVVIIKTTGLPSMSILTFDKAPAAYHSGAAVISPLEEGDPYSPAEMRLEKRR